MVEITQIEKSNFKKGLDYLRERYKAAKSVNDFDAMCDSLESLKCELKTKILAKGNKKLILKVEEILNWYSSLEHRYTVKTPDGFKTVYPPNLDKKVSKNFSLVYEALIKQMDLLELL